MPATDLHTQPYEVICARCGHPWPDNDDDVVYVRIYGDWICADTDACDDRVFEDRQAGGHPDGF